MIAYFWKKTTLAQKTIIAFIILITIASCYALAINGLALTISMLKASDDELRIMSVAIFFALVVEAIFKRVFPGFYSKKTGSLMIDKYASYAFVYFMVVGFIIPKHHILLGFIMGTLAPFFIILTCVIVYPKLREKFEQKMQREAVVVMP